MKKLMRVLVIGLFGLGICSCGVSVSARYKDPNTGAKAGFDYSEDGGVKPWAKVDVGGAYISVGK